MSRYATDEAGLVTIFEPRFRRKFWNKILPEKLTQRDIRISLDETGSAVWQEIDGNKSVQEICGILKARFGEKVEPAEDRVAKFISSLFGNKMITFKEVEGK